MRAMKCPECGLFVKNGEYVINGLEEVISFTGECGKCGTVDLMGTDWIYEELVGDRKLEE